MGEEMDEVKYADVPSEEWIRYMAIFYRALAASERYVETENQVGIWFAGWIVDTLHNVPATLRHYSETYWHSPSRTSEWLHVWSEAKHGPGFSDWMINDCREIFSFDRASNRRTLSIKNESRVNRPPDAICERLLGRLYYWCVWFRRSGSFQNFSNQTPLEEGEKYRRCCIGFFAKGLLPVPFLLTRWSERDWKEYQEMLRTPPAELPEEYRDAWQHFFAPICEN